MCERQSGPFFIKTPPPDFLPGFFFFLHFPGKKKGARAILFPPLLPHLIFVKVDHQIQELLAELRAEFVCTIDLDLHLPQRSSKLTSQPPFAAIEPSPYIPRVCQYLQQLAGYSFSTIHSQSARTTSSSNTNNNDRLLLLLSQ